MTPEQTAKLFQAFTQADVSISSKFGGTGLGLVICQHFCRMMGGNIRVESEAGKGTTFIVTLPADVNERKADAAAASEAAALEDTPAAADSHATVLVIDDDPAVHDLVSRVLAKEGFRVIAARDGEEGLQLARDGHPDAITLDAMMPVMDGWRVLANLKSDPILSSIPVIMLTILEEKNLAFSLGATDYLTKPVDRDRLVGTVSALCKLRDSALVVDDDADAREVVERMLRADGWEVRGASNGQHALELLRQKPASVILLDLMMPVMDGFAFLEELRKHDEWRSLTVIVVTAKDLTEADRNSLNGAVANILYKKGYSRDELLGEVGRQLINRVRLKNNAQASVS
jgi:CheY-like chemotaxis protein